MAHLPGLNVKSLGGGFGGRYKIAIMSIVSLQGTLIVEHNAKGNISMLVHVII